MKIYDSDFSALSETTKSFTLSVSYQCLDYEISAGNRYYEYQIGTAMEPLIATFQNCVYDSVSLTLSVNGELVDSLSNEYGLLVSTD